MTGKHQLVPKIFWAVIAMIDYGPLWETMHKKGITQYQLLKGGVDNRTLDSLKKNKINS